jgi:vancomycin resistance protein YoaR
VLLESSGQEFYFDAAASGIRADPEASVEAAYAYGRGGSFWSDTQHWADAILGGHEIPIHLDIDEATVDATLRSIASTVTRPAEDAYVTYGESGEPVIVPELPGYAFDVTATRNAIIDRLENRSNESVEIVTPLVQAQTTVKDLEPGVAQIKEALQSPLVVTGFGKYWGISAEGLQQILTYRGGESDISVDRDAVASFVQGIADQVDRDAKDAGITVGADGRLAAVPGQTSVAVQQDETTNAIVQALQIGLHQIELAYDSQQPRILDDIAQAAADRGEELLERGVTVKWNGGSQTLDRSDLLAALTVSVRADEDDPFVFGFDKDVLAETLSGTFDSISVKVTEPRLRLVDGQVTIAEEGTNGQEVDIDRSVNAIIDAVMNRKGEATLAIDTVEPELSLPVISKIQLNDVLAESSTYYGDSSDARRHNVEQAAHLQDGWLIAPGQQFSYAEFIGTIEKDNGFVTGFGIIDDPDGTGVTTAPVIGGGICQVSTTIFQSAFWSGLEIDERYSHPYWIQAYGEPPRGMKGLDAMVNIEGSGSLDLKFTNTTKNWIALQVIADGSVLTARILGTDPGWTVSVDQPVITEVRSPDQSTRYTDSPELPEGQQLQVEYAQEGFTSEITRVVTDKDGKVIDSYYLLSTYAPSRNTILRGTGIASTPEAA